MASTALGGGQVDFGNQRLRTHFDGWQAYANTKLMNVLFSHHLAGRITGTGVVSNALCPGLIDTNFFHTNQLFANGGYERLTPRLRPPEEGALVPLYLATDPEAGKVSGAFYIRQGRENPRVRRCSAPVRRHHGLVLRPAVALLVRAGAHHAYPAHRCGLGGHPRKEIDTGRPQIPMIS